MFRAVKALRFLRGRASFGRAWNLLRTFPQEQKNPDIFYTLLAKDTAEFIAAANADIRDEHSLKGLSVLDVGGGPGYFSEAFEQMGAWYVPVEPDVGEMSAAGIRNTDSVRADGRYLPFADSSFDIVYSSNVVEHVDHWELMADEMLRVLKPGGLFVLSYTVWLGPFGGHETGLWQHYVGGHFARRRYEKTHGHPPKNVFGESLFNVSAAAGIRWAKRARGLRNLHFIPRYHPWWAWWVVQVPVLREFFASNLVVIARKH
ncbi:MAG: class I SAM-dependent methyltransferase [Corynebacterium sp.]|nr:class I SAM-dependent methyltransferase [Corynebacterium sp.]